MDVVLIASCNGALQLGSTTLVVVGRWVNVVLGASLSWSSPTAGSNRRQPNSRKAIGLNPIDDSCRWSFLSLSSYQRYLRHSLATSLSCSYPRYLVDQRLLNDRRCSITSRGWAAVKQRYIRFWLASQLRSTTSSSTGRSFGSYRRYLRRRSADGSDKL